MSLRPHHNQYSSNSRRPTHVRDGEGGYYQETTMLYVLSILKDNHNLDRILSDEWKFVPSLPPYPLAVLWTGALSAGKLPLNEHVCILKIGFCVMNENLFLLYPSAVLWTGALSEGKLPLNDLVCILKIGFWVISETCFFTSFKHLLCCELVHSQEVICL